MGVHLAPGREGGALQHQSAQRLERTHGRRWLEKSNHNKVLGEKKINQLPKSLVVAARAARVPLVTTNSLRMMFLILESLIWNVFEEEGAHRALFGSLHVLPCPVSSSLGTTRPGSDGNKGMP